MDVVGDDGTLSSSRGGSANALSLGQGSPEGSGSGSGSGAFGEWDGKVVWWIMGAWVVWSVYGAVVMYLAYKRRNLQPLKARSPALTTASALGGYVLLTWCCWLQAHFLVAEDGLGFRGPYTLCSVGIWALYIGHPLLLIPYILRCYRLYFVFNYNVEQVEKQRLRAMAHRRAPSVGSTCSNSPRRVRSTSPVQNGTSGFPVGDGQGEGQPGHVAIVVGGAGTPRRAGGGEGGVGHGRGGDGTGVPTATRDSSSFFYYEKKHRMSEAWLLRRLAFVLSFFVMYTVANQVMIETYPKSSYIANDVCPSQHMGFVMEWEVIEFIEQIIFVLALYHLWDVIDTFSIRTELLSIFIVWILWSGLRVGLALTSGPRLWLHYESVLVILRSAVLFTVSVCMPLLHTYGIAAGELTLWSFPSSLESLDTVLKDNLCMQFFQRYMTQRLSVQHVNFWLSVELYKDIDTDMEVFSNERFEEAQRLYSEYIGTEAESPIALLTVGQRLNIKNELLTQRAPLALFDEAKMAVFHDMESNAFPGFLKSKLYKKLKVKLEIQRQTYGTLKAYRMVDERAM